GVVLPAAGGGEGPTAGGAGAESGDRLDRAAPGAVARRGALPPRGARAVPGRRGLLRRLGHLPRPHPPAVPGGARGGAAASARGDRRGRDLALAAKRLALRRAIDRRPDGL